jgi:subtilisin-like proprotein convertase family protein
LKKTYSPIGYLLLVGLALLAVHALDARLEARNIKQNIAERKTCGRIVHGMQEMHLAPFSLDDYFASTDVPKSIPDGPNGDTVTSILDISSTDTIHDLNVRLTITHTWIRDLRISLVAPPPHDTMEVVLLNLFPGDSVLNMTDCWFDDEAADSINGGHPPFTGFFRPQQALSRFDNLLIQGQWTLRVLDRFHADTGSVQSWGIEINPPVNLQGTVRRSQDNAVLAGARIEVLGANREAVTNASGQYEISGIDSGSYAVVFSAQNYESDTVEQVLITSGQITTLNATLNSQFIFRDYHSREDSAAIADLDTAIMALSVSDSFLISDLDVTVNIHHTYPGDLVVWLTSPWNQQVTLASRPDSGIRDGFIECRFDDEATARADSSDSPFTGSYRPTGSLSILDNHSVAGVWTLFAYDAAELDTGWIVNFTLHLTTTSLAVPAERLTPPQIFVFYGNYPNPFNATTMFSFDLTRQTYVKLALYNILGQEVARLVDKPIAAGAHQFSFDGSSLTSGLYFARLTAGGASETRKVILLK